MMDLLHAARLLRGKVNGRGINCPGRGHSARDESLSIIFSPSAPDGLLVFDHAGGNHLAAKDYVRERLGLSVQLAPKPPERPVNVENIRVGPSSDRTALALRIWRAAQPATGSPVEAYLASRGLALPADVHEVIRYVSACPFAGTRTPAMVALVRNVVTDEPQAIHRTAITLDGEKAFVNGRDRLALGSLRSGAVKLTADADVTYCLGIGEGIESTLSLQGLPEFGTSPIWALLNTTGVIRFTPLPGIESLWLAVDHDAGGEKAADTCAGRWRFAGTEVFLVRAVTPGQDLNDIVKEVAHG